MSEQLLGSIFANAATPQKIALVGLVLAFLFVPALAFLARYNTAPWRRLLSDLRIAAPTFGLLVGAMNSFHMARTIQKLPIEVTAKQLVPGMLEVSTFIALGGLVGLVASGALAIADAQKLQQQT